MIGYIGFAHILSRWTNITTIITIVHELLVALSIATSIPGGIWKAFSNSFRVKPRVSPKRVGQKRAGETYVQAELIDELPSTKLS